MAALTKDRTTARQKAAPAARAGRRGLAADAVIFLGAGIAKDSDGYLVPMDDAAAIEIVGISEEHADNTGGDDGDVTCAYKTGVEVEFDNDGTIGQADLGRACYAIDDQTVGDAGSAANDMFVGVVQEFTADKVFVFVDEAHGVTETLEGPFDGGDAAVVATAQVLGGIPVVHVIDVADAASGDTDVVLTDKTEIVGIQGFKIGGAGDAANSYTVKNGANAISDAIDGDLADKAVIAAATIDDATNVIAAAGTLRISHVKGGGNSAARFVIYGVKRA